MNVRELIQKLLAHSPTAAVHMSEYEQDDGFEIGEIVGDEKVVVLLSGNAIGDHCENALRAEIKRVRKALLEHRWDLHHRSSRPCPTCRESAEALGLKVPNECAKMCWDKEAIEKADKESFDV